MPQTADTAAGAPYRTPDERVRELASQLPTLGPLEAMRLLKPHPDPLVEQVLQAINPSTAQAILDQFAVERRQAIIAAAPVAVGRQWLHNQSFPEDSVGRLMDPAIAVFRRDMTVG